MAFHENLNDSLTKERGGRHGGKGHEFQRYWALCHLLKLDLEQNDYILMVEFIEDVAVLNTATAPTELDLFQIKKKEGAVGAKWTKTTLVKPPKEGKSILAKLYESKRISPDAKASIAFVSNAPVDLTLHDGSASTERERFCADELEVTLKGSLQKSIADELKCDVQDIEFGALKFIRSPLAMDDLETHAIGRVSSYLGVKFPTHGARADVFCKALYGEIKIRATSTQDAASFAELCEIRGIAKSQFDLMLATTLARKPDGEIINTAISSLTQENVPFVERNKVKEASRRYLIDKAGKGGAILASLEQAIEHHFSNIPNSLITSWGVANWIENEITTSAQASKFSMLDKAYLLAAILYRINQ
ncbi:MAG: DUF4297 domain-containing protein [Undibacterium sp.]|uniref:DUF4297 domain-containing protein n=1 Tax=Undibacterium sp. TaxID=1914977 RepID=UPI002717C196|nr:DUF4297 domain-containing protein [Undibacterium sp.]MDO8651671.1 DUF4297 domain-containing protein [Undibacterium sp.]